MANTTPILGLHLPEREDFVSVVNDIDDNMNIIDTAVWGKLSPGGMLPVENSITGIAIAAHSDGDYIYFKTGGLAQAIANISPGDQFSLANVAPAPYSTGVLNHLEYELSNQNEAIEKLQDGIAIVANGNTHAAIPANYFVYVKGHGTLSDGLYKNTSGSTIAANATLSSSNLTADADGGLNTLYNNIATKAEIAVIEGLSNGTTKTYTLPTAHVYLIVCGHPYSESYIGIYASWSGGAQRLTHIKTSAQLSVVVDSSSNTLTISATGNMWLRILDLGYMSA